MMVNIDSVKSIFFSNVLFLLLPNGFQMDFTMCFKIIDLTQYSLYWIFASMIELRHGFQTVFFLFLLNGLVFKHNADKRNEAGLTFSFINILKMDLSKFNVNMHKLIAELVPSQTFFLFTFHSVCWID